MLKAENEQMICAGAKACGDVGCEHHEPHCRMDACGVDCQGNEFDPTTVCVPFVENTPQQQVAENTARRGYREGWTAEQFAARQVCKLVEELSEFDSTISGYGHTWRRMLEDAAWRARRAFDDPDQWGVVGIFTDLKKAQSELADIQVVVFNLAQALSEITGEPFDVVKAAVEKSAADVDRGVR